MKTQLAKLIPLLARGLVPTTAAASGLLSPLASGAPGDLDPEFGDVGRLGPILNGPAWALEPTDDAGPIVGGGGSCAWWSWYYWYYCPILTNFVTQLSDTGATDPNFVAPPLDDTQIIDIARQPDGQVIAVGRRVVEGSNLPLPIVQLVVMRLQAHGPLDETFGSAGLFGLSTAEHGGSQAGTSVVLDPDGRIVIAGSNGNQVIVLRLLPDGSLDDSFGTSGVFEGPETLNFTADNLSLTQVRRTATGGYRVTASNAAGCQVVGLTASGAVDPAFGTLGIATVAQPSGPSTYCKSLDQDGDGRLLLVGESGGQAFAARLLPDGQPDPDFSAGAALDGMTDATAVTAADDGAVIVAGRGVSGTSIMRLLASGELDALFGNAGSTLVDIDSPTGPALTVHDLDAGTDGSVLAAGGDDRSDQAFVVRLLGSTGGDSPGVVGIADQSAVWSVEGDSELVVNLRRTGGDFGSVSVAYQAVPQGWNPATPDADFIPVSGRITWNDGDRSDKQVLVPIVADGVTEDEETLVLELSGAQGGAGLGTRMADLHIGADGKPFGQLGFEATDYVARESQTVSIGVWRGYYSSGAVSVTVTPIPGTATAGSDYTAGAVTLSWADGDTETKYVNIPITDDAAEEPSEQFTLELTAATGGALIGTPSITRVAIAASDRKIGSTRSGGAIGYLSLLLLGVAGLFRSWMARVRNPG